MNRQRLLVIMLTLLVVAAMACRNSDEKVSNGAAGTTDTSTTSTSGTDTSGTTTTSSAASTATSSSGGTVSNLSDADKEFVMKAAIGGIAEVQMGQTASQKGQNAEVKAFGTRMVSDHSKANDALKQLATTKGLAVPSDVDAKHQKTADEIAAKNGKDFDRAYMADMVKDHEEDVKEFEHASQTAKDADLKTWASKMLPTLREHLRMAKDTAKKVK